MTGGIGIGIAVTTTVLEDMAVIDHYALDTPMDMATGMDTGITTLLAFRYELDFNLDKFHHSLDLSHLVCLTDSALPSGCPELAGQGLAFALLQNIVAA